MLTKLLNRGINITVATARSLASIKKILKDLELDLPVISFNGGYVSDYKSCEHLAINNISHSLAYKLYEYISNSSGCLISTFDGEKDVLYYDRVSSEGHQQYIDDRERFFGKTLPQLNGLDELENSKIMAFTVIDQKDKIVSLYNALRSEFSDQVIIHHWEDMYYQPWYWLTIHSLESTKAKAIKTLEHMVDITYDELVVFGDNLNDIEMFQYADKAYAVENAVEAIKELATEVIDHHELDGVVKQIMKLEGE
jgi:Cof subfamily protein (haloacid dehalogenase superfamily)